MTKEVDIQKDVVDAVNGAGGFAFKMSHKFKVGVVDLSVQLAEQLMAVDPTHRKPDIVQHYPHLFVEVKLARLARITSGQTIKLDVTVLQERFLRSAAGADPTRLRGAVMSFIKVARKRALLCAVYDIRSLQRPFAVQVSDHASLDDRERGMLTMLSRFCQEEDGQ